MNKGVFDKFEFNKIISCELSNKTLDMILVTIDEEDEGDEIELIADKYILHEELGKGSFGTVYRSTDHNNNEYAIKFEDKSDLKEHLAKEYLIYSSLKKSRNFPKIYHYGEYKNSRILVMQRLGVSLKQLFTNRNYFFNMNTISNIAVQVLYRLQELHDKGWLHQDIKPENILIDNTLGQKIYLVDYGTSGFWWDNEHKTHVEEVHSNKIVGTARYSSLGNHKGINQSRRDDLESLGYMLVYFIKKRLPWQGISTKTFRQKWREVRKIKEKTRIEVLCKGLPYCFSLYFYHITTIRFQDTPNYSYLRDLFRHNITSDFNWD